MSGLRKDGGTIQRAIQMLAGVYDKDLLSFEVACIISVDTRNWVCTARLVSGKTQNVYSNVQLTSEKASNGFIQVPKAGSNVILAITFRNEVYVFMCSEIDALVFHQLNADGKTYEEFVINCNSGFSPDLPLGIQIADGGGNGVVITSGAATATNSNGNNGITITCGNGTVDNDDNGIVISNNDGTITNCGNGIIISNSSNPPSNSSNGILISCSGTIQLNDGSYNGLLIGANVATKLNNLENLINDLIIQYNSHTHILALSSGTGTAAPTITQETGSIVMLTQESDLENDAITHGPRVN